MAITYFNGLDVRIRARMPAAHGLPFGHSCDTASLLTVSATVPQGGAMPLCCLPYGMK